MTAVVFQDDKALESFKKAGAYARAVEQVLAWVDPDGPLVVHPPALADLEAQPDRCTTMLQ